MSSISRTLRPLSTAFPRSGVRAICTTQVRRDDKPHEEHKGLISVSSGLSPVIYRAELIRGGIQSLLHGSSKAQAEGLVVAKQHSKLVGRGKVSARSTLGLAVARNCRVRVGVHPTRRKLVLLSETLTWAVRARVDHTQSQAGQGGRVPSGSVRRICVPD